MNYLRKKQIILKFLYLIVFIGLYSCNKETATEAKQPTLKDYTVGEKWVWKYKGVTDKGEVRSDGEDVRKIVKMPYGLGITIGKDTVPVSDMVKPDESETPRYKWPLKVGKKWKYEKNWTSQDGTTGKQSQDVEVLSYKDNISSFENVKTELLGKQVLVTGRASKNTMFDRIEFVASNVAIPDPAKEIEKLEKS